MLEKINMKFKSKEKEREFYEYFLQSSGKAINAMTKGLLPLLFIVLLQDLILVYAFHKPKTGAHFISAISILFLLILFFLQRKVQIIKQYFANLFLSLFYIIVTEIYFIYDHYELVVIS
jgi:hypothetical protein